MNKKVTRALLTTALFITLSTLKTSTIPSEKDKSAVHHALLKKRSSECKNIIAHLHQQLIDCLNARAKNAESNNSFDCKIEEGKLKILAPLCEKAHAMKTKFEEQLKDYKSIKQ